MQSGLSWKGNNVFGREWHKQEYSLPFIYSNSVRMKTLVVQNQFLEGVASLLEDGQTVRIRIGGSSMDPLIRGGVDEVELVPYVSGDELPLWTGVFFRW